MDGMLGSTALAAAVDTYIALMVDPQRVRRSSESSAIRSRYGAYISHLGRRKASTVSRQSMRGGRPRKRQGETRKRIEEEMVGIRNRTSWLCPNRCVLRCPRQNDH